MKNRANFIRVGLLTLLFASSLAAADVRIGVLNYRGAEQVMETWGGTVEYLRRALPDREFRLLPLDFVALDAALSAGELDFVLTNPGNYVQLEAAYGISRIATVESSITDDPNYSIGSAVVVRRDNQALQELDDLKDHSLLAVDRGAFGGYQVAEASLRAAGVEPGDLRLRFIGFPMDRVAHAVAAGEADAGILRACLLERMVVEGQLPPGELRVLAPQNHYGFRCTASTPLYPDWPFAKARDTSRELAKRVTQALFALESDEAPAAFTGWTIPVDYQPVHDLFRRLELPPYSRDSQMTPVEMVRRYWPWLLGLLLSAVWMVWHTARVEQQVRVRTAQLSAANERLKQAMQEQAAAERVIRQREAELAHAARVNTVGELAAGMAHEVNQPLAAIGNYAEGCLVRLRQQEAAPELIDALREIDTQAARAGAIVHRLRSFLRKEEPRPVPIDLNDAVIEAVSLFAPEAHRHHVALRTVLAPSLPRVCGESIQLEQVVLNLMRNALEVLEEAECERREIEVISARVADGVRVTVMDSGPGLSEEARQHLFEPFFTTKPQGMGLGLSISRSIIEAHGGGLAVADAPNGGAALEFTLPVAKDDHEL
ncbi:sensor histidine kinase [Thiohalomonas denitrificans]|uniref:histidine kinase n=1 Tax=Thiohalomonas denitrificans TaxID=415747 RepID=A0A1G5QM01_9GAMM|nr:sensor histidine kinase [Thiohalomonas denitrificans]SCZ62752.1 two-component system, LuxR family, sensor histidine kinase TtrS [Thiohalomonas denitrificans]